MAAAGAADPAGPDRLREQPPALQAREYPFFPLLLGKEDLPGDAEGAVSVQADGLLAILLQVGGQADWDPYEDRSVWTTYRVYQAPDGRPYLDGSGNSFTGALGSYQESQTYTRQENGGDVKKETVEVSISIKAVPRLEGLGGRQFGFCRCARSFDLCALSSDGQLRHAAHPGAVQKDNRMGDGLLLRSGAGVGRADHALGAALLHQNPGRLRHGVRQNQRGFHRISAIQR